MMNDPISNAKSDPIPDFIETYDHALDPDLCADIIRRFEASSEQVPGQTGNGLLPEHKLSLDITISRSKHWSDVIENVETITFQYLAQYMRKFAFALTGALEIRIPDPARPGELVSITPTMIHQMPEHTVDLMFLSLFGLSSVQGTHFWPLSYKESNP